MSSTCWRAERRAVPRAQAHTHVHAQPKPARVPSGAEPGREQSSGLFTPGEGLGHLTQRGLQDRPMYPSDEGQT
jgi:hypothetical protein